MEFRFTAARTAILVILLAVFWLLDGFDFHPEAGRQVVQAWGCSVAMFVVGATMISIVDHWVGNLDRSNLRWLYVVMGTLLIAGSFMYQMVLRDRMRITAGNTPAAVE